MVGWAAVGAAVRAAVGGALGGGDLTLLRLWLRRGWWRNPARRAAWVAGGVGLGPGRLSVEFEIQISQLLGLVDVWCGGSGEGLVNRG